MCILNSLVTINLNAGAVMGFCLFANASRLALHLPTLLSNWYRGFLSLG